MLISFKITFFDFKYERMNKPIAEDIKKKNSNPKPTIKPAYFNI